MKSLLLEIALIHYTSFIISLQLFYSYHEFSWKFPCKWAIARNHHISIIAMDDCLKSIESCIDIDEFLAKLEVVLFCYYDSRHSQDILHRIK